MNGKKILPCFVFSLFLLSSTLFVQPSQAAERTIVPSLGLMAEYNDNIDFDHNGIERDDFIFTVSPGLSLDYKTERTTFGATARVDVFKYADYTDEDYNRQIYGLKASHKLLERLSVRARAGYIRDTTQDSYLEDTGIITTRSTVHRYSGGAGLTYNLTEVSDLDFDYNHRQTDYTSEGDVDTQTDTAGFAYRHAFLERRYILTVAPVYTRDDSDESTVNSYSLALGLSHRFRETLVANISAGTRYSDTEYHLRDTSDTNWDWIADASVTQTWETATASIGYARNLYYSSDGDAVNVDRFYARASKRFTEQFGASLAGTLYFTKSDGNFNNEDSRYYQISPSLFYNITRDHRLELGYSYTNDRDKTLDDDFGDREIERNRVWLLMTFNFPYNW